MLKPLILGGNKHPPFPPPTPQNPQKKKKALLQICLGQFSENSI